MKNLGERYLQARKEYLLTTFEAMLSYEGIRTIFGESKQPNLSSEELWDIVIYYLRDEHQQNLYIEKKDETNKMKENIHYFRIRENEYAKVVIKKDEGYAQTISEDELEKDIEDAVLSHSNIGFNNSCGKYQDISYLKTEQIVKNETVKENDEEKDENKDVIVYKDYLGNNYYQKDIMQNVMNFAKEMKVINVCKEEEKDAREEI